MTDAESRQPAPRPSVGVLFKCCNVYSRIYANHNQSAYAGHCPRCAARIEVPISKSGGSNSRFLSGS
ncbi:MAG: hypothetical protein CME32_30045 [Gimesia sp.]|uniref:Uncharacterized protein n=1 Tax=Gimesia chilikensis TaxID=2605989 RepID=A0A517PPI8_9PLAN|nr:hypothetical protein FYZ48_11705 [Gimesia chilikensis]MBN73518.1 hypothetical protein [Gimesia sp.]QDT21293.1 hypothetical protein HG66A1_30920 [Gimesia chilikensis]